MPALCLILGLFFGYLIGAPFREIGVGVLIGGASGFLLGMILDSRSQIRSLTEKLDAAQSTLAELERKIERAALDGLGTRLSVLEGRLRQRHTEQAEEPPATDLSIEPSPELATQAALGIPAAKTRVAPASAAPLQEDIAPPTDEFISFHDEPATTSQAPEPAPAMVAEPATLTEPETLTLAPLDEAPVAEPTNPATPVERVAVQQQTESADTPATARQDAHISPSRARTTPRPRRAPIEKEHGPGLIAKAFTAARDWLFGGNTLVRMGMVLVFLGLAFLLRYASDRVVIPLELRYIAVAGAAFVALMLGWRLREKRPAYALLMQGGSVAVMYLTTFAAMKLHGEPLLPTQLGLFVMIAVAGLSGVLAISQNAMSLAVAGSLGGFAAPVLVSTGGGSHIALFSYFALLNTVILGIAWFKAWRPLNLVGFFGTFLIGLAWGLRSYEAQHYASTQGFLVLFFLMFVAIGLLFARRMLLEDPDTPVSDDTEAWLTWLAQQGQRAQRYVDGTILFGTPLVGFGLQHAIVKHIEFGSAFSAAALGFFYLLLARVVQANQPVRCRLLTEVFLALGVVFASLAIPLGLNAEWTSAAWAVEAAGIYWIGHRQHRPLARAFALLLQLGAGLSYLSQIRPGSDTVLEGSALGALMLGLSLLCNQLVHRRHVDDSAARETWDGGFRLIFASLGLWSLFLMAPILNPLEGTAVSLSLICMVVLALGLRHGLDGWQGNALIALGFAALCALATLHRGLDTLLDGSPVAFLIVGGAFLGSVGVMRWFLRKERHPEVATAAMPLLSTLGLWSLYLIAPLKFAADNTACSWALAGLATAFIGIRLQARGWLGNALLVQLAAGVLFILKLQHANGAEAVLTFGGSGWNGLVIAMLVGFSSLVSLGLAVQEARHRADEAAVQRLAWMMVFGLGLLSLAVLFVLPWQTATAVWAGCGFLLLWAAQRLRLMPAFWFAIGLELLAGFAFASTHLPQLVLHNAEASAFAHMGFWTPIVIALSAFAVAWRLHCVSQSSDNRGAGFALPGLLWSAAWWAMGWSAELSRLAGPLQRGDASHQFLAVMAVSVLLLLGIGKRWRWSQLVGLCFSLLPLTAYTGWQDYDRGLHLFGSWGALAYAAALVAQWVALRVAADLISIPMEKRLHVLANWVLLAVASLELRYLFLQLGDEGSAWRWLGWVLPLVAWLAWSARQTPPTRWPAARWPDLYRFSTTLPVVLCLLGWLALANVQSGGNSAPLPYLPIANPLELAMLLILFASWRWLACVEDCSPRSLTWQSLHQPLRLVVLAGGFLTYTCAVLRAVHYYAALPYAVEPLLHSMLVQASLSLAWSLCAIGLMIAGNRIARREVWITGAVLVAVVVAKLFLIELSNRGGLERIVSFIGVGVLLLVVGYFAPLPARKEEES